MIYAALHFGPQEIMEIIGNTKKDNVLINADSFAKCKATAEWEKVWKDTNAIYPSLAPKLSVLYLFFLVLFPALEKHQRSYCVGKVQSGTAHTFIRASKWQIESCLPSCVGTGNWISISIIQKPITLFNSLPCFFFMSNLIWYLRCY